MSEKKLVAVQWLDAHGSSITAYAEHEIPHAAFKITSYGLLIKEDEAGISIASELCEDNTYRGVTFIPKGMIVKISPVKRERKKPIAPLAPLV